MFITKFIISLVLVFCLFIFSCIFDPTSPDDLIYYYNSFETFQDTIGWHGISNKMFVKDSAPHCGEKSLLINGGCLQPAARKKFTELKKMRRLTLSCWGKVNQKSQTGRVVLCIADGPEDSDAISITIKDTSWTYYKNTLSFVCYPKEALQLEMWIGGIVPASMNIDGITVAEID